MLEGTVAATICACWNLQQNYLTRGPLMGEKKRENRNGIVINEGGQWNNRQSATYGQAGGLFL